MSFFLTLIMMCFSANIFAGEIVNSIIDALRTEPAAIVGTFSVDKPKELYRGKAGIMDILDTKFTMNAKKEVGFTFSEETLTIGSGDGLTVSVQGFPVKVTQIYYDAKAGTFSVKTSAPLGLLEKKVAKRVEDTLTAEYRPKMIQAYNEIKKIRSSQTMNDTGKILKSISKIFDDGKPSEPLNMKGNLDLVFGPLKKQILTFGDWKASVKEGDRFTVGVEFNKKAIDAVNFSSSLGIQLYGKTSYPEIVSVDFTSLRFNNGGVTFTYDLGAEEVMLGYQLVFGLLAAYNARMPATVINNATICDPPKIKAVREVVDKNLREELVKLVRNHRDYLRESGVSEEFLKAFE
jgi:hypothetical protein